jgi:hypothetical protein
MRIAALVDGADAELVADRVSQLLGLSSTTGGAEEAHWAARKLFEGLARTRPLVLVFEEMEHAEPGFLDLLEHITELSRGRPILIVCVARPELRETRQGWGGGTLNATSILLEPLGEADAARLVERLLDGELDPAVSARTSTQPRAIHFSPRSTSPCWWTRYSSSEITCDGQPPWTFRHCLFRPRSTPCSPRDSIS